jgi:hypothetical protein
MPEPIFMKLGVNIMAPELLSTAYFIHPSDQCACQYVHPPIVARQRFGKNVTAATNTQEQQKSYWTHRLLYEPCRIKGKQAISSSQNFLFFV